MSTQAAICIGHARSGDNGAESVDGTNEYEWNSDLAVLIKQELDALGVTSSIIDHYDGSSYGSAMDSVADQIAAMGADLAIELHFNSADDASAHGFEHLYWSSSPNGLRLAEDINMAQEDSFPTKTNRGVKPKSSGDRGSGFLSKTPCPATLGEPFFGSNTREWMFYDDEKLTLAKSIATGIHSYLNT